MKHGIITRTMARTSLALAGAALLALGSCIDDDLSGCFPSSSHNVRLKVTTDYEHEGRLTRGSAEAEWYAGIDSVTVYVFDQNDICVAVWTGGAYSMGDEYIAGMNFEEDGLYHFMAWTNVGDHFSPSHQGESPIGLSSSEITMRYNIPPDDDVLREDISHQHHGVLENAMIVADRVNNHTIVLGSRTYKVNFFARNLDGEAGRYEVEVTDSNMEHTLHGEHIPAEDDTHYHHRREMVRDVPSNDLEASMILLHIGDDSETLFSIEDLTKGRSIYSADLLATIQRAYKLTDAAFAEMLETSYEYDIILTFSDGGEGGSLGVEVEVKAWGYKPNPIDL